MTALRLKIERQKEILDSKKLKHKIELEQLEKVEHF
jgi:hypothetical protein